MARRMTTGMMLSCALAALLAGAPAASAAPAAGEEKAESKTTRTKTARTKTTVKTRKSKTVRRTENPKAAAPAPAVTKEPAAPASDGRFTFGGAIRARYDARFNDARPISGERYTSSHFSFDTLALKAKYDSSTVFASGQYRIYGGSFIYGKRAGYENYPGEVHFPMWAYAGLKLTPQDSISGGISQAPFGLTPYFGSSFLESVGFTAGIEEVYNLGLKYSHEGANWNWDLAYYPGMAPEGKGISRESARYSANMVRADSYVPDGSNNHERHMAVGRIERTFFKDDVASFKAGVSGWFSKVHNLNTNGDGFKALEAVHFDATWRNWGFKGIYVRQDVKVKNPGRDDIFTIGSYDGSYNIAAKGNLVSGEINYKIPNDIGPFAVQPYLNYSAFIKDKAKFKTTERYILGAAWTLTADPRLIIYSEFIWGKNDPYVGAGQYTSGLAQGGDDKWKKSAIINIGYYF